MMDGGSGEPQGLPQQSSRSSAQGATGVPFAILALAPSPATASELTSEARRGLHHNREARDGGRGGAVICK